MMNGTTLALIKKLQALPRKIPSRVGWTEGIGSESITKSNHSPRSSAPALHEAGSGTFHARRPNLAGVARVSQGLNPPPFLMRRHEYRVNWDYYTALFGKVQHLCRFCKKKCIHLRGRSPPPFVGSAIKPDRYASACRAASRPSLIAHTIRDCPRRASPAAKMPGTFVW